MERTHKGEPVIITWESTPCEEMIKPLGERHDRVDSIEERSLYLAFLENERKVEVITWIGNGAFRTRELTPLEMLRFEEAYRAGKCTAEFEGVKRRIKPEPKRGC